MSLKTIPIASLVPHPANPRFVPRQDIVDQIAAQLEASGRFDEMHSLIVRPLNGQYQIISGHQRRLAAMQAGIQEIPCWVRDDIQFDPYAEIADALMFTRDACPVTCMSMHEQFSLTTVNIAFQDQLFIGERVYPQNGKIDWLKDWIKISILPDALALWDIPVCPDISTWTLRRDACFLRANGGMFSLDSMRRQCIPRELPDRPDDIAFERYTGTECIYFVQAKILRLIKIGFSSNVPKRLAALKSGCPDSLEILNIIPGGAALEKVIHQRFSQHRVRGEWFTPTTELVDFIQNGGE